MVNIKVRNEYRWKRLVSPESELWFKGYLLDGLSLERLHYKLERILSSQIVSISDFRLFIDSLELKGHFSLIIKKQNKVFAMTDRIGSVPLIYHHTKQDLIIGDHAQKVAHNINKITNREAFLELSMSGYTIGKKTLYESIFQLTAGEMLLFNNGELNREYYYTYTPWLVKNRTLTSLKNKFKDVFLSSLEEVVKESSGRQIVVPLSAGNDSRAIASALKYIGSKNVLCFSYGRKNNFEMRAGQLISEKLGYEWIGIPLTLAGQRKFYSSSEFKSFLSTIDMFSSSPHIQEVSAINILRKNKLIDNNAIILNGSTGDYISGGHIPTNHLGQAFNMDAYFESFLSKHYGLWKNLSTNYNDSCIYKELISNFEQRCNVEINSIKATHGVFECIEYLGRQSKYIMGMQRVYEFYGYDWRLPFWSNQMLDYWESVPVDYKYNSNLYKSMLVENNWGGVWTSEFNFNHNPFNTTINSLRLLLKFFALPFGESGKQLIDKNIFGYMSDVTCTSPIVPYSKMLFDTKGHRNNASWISKKYLNNKSLN
jgi:asparagine synthase (glutamine-hydrolysing)